MNIVFWGSSPFSMPSLRQVFGHHTVKAVVTNEDSSCGRGLKELRMTPVKEFALEHNIPVLQPCSLKDELFIKSFEDQDPDLSVVVSYGMIIPEKLLYFPKFHSINLHASLLPEYRGASPIQAALKDGRSFTGNSVQFMVKELDKGDVILHHKTAILPDDNYTTLSEKLSEEGAKLLLEAIENIQNGKALRMKQDESLATFTKLIKKEDGKISFIANTAVEIYNKWRAFYQWPGIFADFSNLPYCTEAPEVNCVTYFTKIIPAEGMHGIPGTILQADKKGLVIACKEGAVSILSMKPAGRKEMDFTSFINGYKPTIGSYF